jgi:polyisoprenoid-binding protein YceI
MMKKLLLLFIATFFILAACSRAPAATTFPETTATQPGSIDVASQPLETEQVQPTEMSEPTQEPTAQPAATDNAQPTANQVSTSSLTIFKIVPGESQLQYEVGEVFINDNNRFAVAIGVTPQVEGEISIDRTAPQNSTIGTITADISQFKSDNGRRDNAIRGRFLESERFPMVIFVPTQIEGLSDSYQDGQEIPLKISGDLTIRDVTRPVSFDATVRLDGDQLSGQAATIILMSDYQFGPISIGGVLKTEDEAKITMTFVARP